MSGSVDVHLVDGTYELFRHFYAVPSHRDRDGQEVGATRGVVDSMLRLLESGATHVGVATDHVIESFRNELHPGYKTGGGIDPDLRSQFPVLERALTALGVTVWPMVAYEADDALAAAAARAAAAPDVGTVLILTPDKDLAQCVRDPDVVQVDRRTGRIYDVAGVRAKFGVEPRCIPDFLALVGDAADGFPGLPGFGAKTAAALLARFGTIAGIPDDHAAWDVPGIRGAARLAGTLRTHRAEANLYRRLATLVTDGPDVGEVRDWRWTGAAPDLEVWAHRLGSPALETRARRLAEARASG